MLKKLAFSSSGLLICILVVATIIEPFLGTEFVKKYFYTSPLTIGLWVVAVFFLLFYLFQRRVYKNLIVFLLHFSFVIILAGAFVTHIFGKQGTIHLRIDEPQNEFVDDEGIPAFFEFSENNEKQFVTLTDFCVEYYNETLTPKDFVSNIEITDGEQKVFGRVAMNKIFSYNNYRFYQQTYDDDEQGVTFLINYDPYGIAITYCGYLLLFFCLIAFFFQKDTRFRRLCKKG